jgi:hypothetical protein
LAPSPTVLAAVTVLSHSPISPVPGGPAFTTVPPEAACQLVLRLSAVVLFCLKKFVAQAVDQLEQIIL